MLSLLTCWHFVAYSQPVFPVKTSDFSENMSRSKLVISQEDLKNQGIITLDNFLRFNTNLFFEYQRKSGFVHTFNNDLNPDILILKNGQFFLSTTFSPIDLNAISLNQVKQIEIYIDNIALKYGASTSGIVINLITYYEPDVLDSTSIQINTNYGTQGDFNLDGEFIQYSARHYFGLGFFRNYSSGRLDSDSRLSVISPNRLSGFGAQYQYKISNEIHSGIRTEYTNYLLKDYGEPLPFTIRAYDFEKSVKQFTTQAYLKAKFQNDYSFNLSLSFSNINEQRHNFLRDLSTLERLKIDQTLFADSIQNRVFSFLFDYGSSETISGYNIGVQYLLYRPRILGEVANSFNHPNYSAYASYRWVFSERVLAKIGANAAYRSDQNLGIYPYIELNLVPDVNRQSQINIRAKRIFLLPAFNQLYAENFLENVVNNLSLKKMNGYRAEAIFTYKEKDAVLGSNMRYSIIDNYIVFDDQSQSYQNNSISNLFYVNTFINYRKENLKAVLNLFYNSFENKIKGFNKENVKSYFGLRTQLSVQTRIGNFYGGLKLMRLSEILRNEPISDFITYPDLLLMDFSWTKKVFGMIILNCSVKNILNNTDLVGESGRGISILLPDRRRRLDLGLSMML